VLQSRKQFLVDVKIHWVRSVFLISGEFLGERIDEVVESHEVGVGEKVLKALFASETIKNSEAKFEEKFNTTSEDHSTEY
jgi:hypothetical protein